MQNLLYLIFVCVKIYQACFGKVWWMSPMEPQPRLLDRFKACPSAVIQLSHSVITCESIKMHVVCWRHFSEIRLFILKCFVKWLPSLSHIAYCTYFHLEGFQICDRLNITAPLYPLHDSVIPPALRPCLQNSDSLLVHVATPTKKGLCQEFVHSLHLHTLS